MAASISTVSARRIRANRRNAKKSTGPRTAEGKARSSRNASTHGLFCRDLVLAGESRRVFEALRVMLIAEHRPQTITELLLVDRIVSAAWRLRRLHATEAMAHDAVAEHLMAEHDRQLARRRRKYERDLEFYDPQQDPPEERPVAPESLVAKLAGRPIPAECTMHAILASEQHSVLDKLNLYERRLEGTIYRSLRDLRKLRTPARGEHIPDSPSPFLSSDELAMLHDPRWQEDDETDEPTPEAHDDEEQEHDRQPRNTKPAPEPEPATAPPATCAPATPAPQAPVSNEVARVSSKLKNEPTALAETLPSSPAAAPSPLEGEGENACALAGQDRRVDEGRFTPHPSPLPQGERG